MVGRSNSMLKTASGIIHHGDCEAVLKNLDPVDLIFTSPPYFNARDYTTYANYNDYLCKMNRVFQECWRVLRPGRFMVVNSSPVLVPRAGRQFASSRLPIPFDLHAQVMKSDFEFIDDIVWVKPEGAGWVSGRGRRFSADRNPLQYKCVPVTEYLFVYRKICGKLIDWNIRSHDQQIVKDSKILGDYDVTNIWQIKPSHDSRHPAVFPMELASRVIRYYSFLNDVVLDPFGGIGTTAKAAVSMGRQFVMVEQSKEYYDHACDDLVNCFNVEIDAADDSL